MSPPSAAARVAGGAGIVLAGAFVDRGLRFAVNWLLSGALGPAGFGLYTWASTWAATVTAFAPLGLDTAIVYFVGRHRQAGERGRELGALRLGLGLSAAMGALGAVGMGVAALIVDDPARGSALGWAAPSVALWTPLMFLVGAQRAAKDMRGSTMALQVLLPAALAGLSGVAVALGLGLPGALASLVLATGLGLGWAIRGARRAYRGLLADRGLRPEADPRALLGFSLPQGLTAAAFRLNSTLDVLMLAALAGDEAVGVYKVAASLAAFGALPSNAVVSVFNPWIVELHQKGDRAALNALLKTVTRWLIALSAPAFVALLVLAEPLIGLFDPVYGPALIPLLVLLGGQAAQTACAPAMRLIPMSGRTWLNLANGAAALALNLALNALLIPAGGAPGAALAAALTLSLWSGWRLVEVWHLLRCWPFEWRGGLILGASAAAGLGARALADGLGGRALGALLALMAVGAVILAVSRTPEDREVLQRVRQKLGRVRGAR